jgi:methylmalonyl-CoA/ethylmalonyl-CoA epimerase
MIKGIGHIALAVRDIEGVVAALCRIIGRPLPAINVVPDRCMKVALIEVGPVQIELLEDLSQTGVIAQHVAAHGNSIHHFCLITDAIGPDLEKLKQQEVPLMDLVPREGLRGKRIAFISPELLKGIPIELSDP